MKLPRMVVVPLAMVLFLMEQPQLPNEIYHKLVGKIVESGTTGDHLRREDYDMLLKWCLTAT